MAARNILAVCTLSLPSPELLVPADALTSVLRASRPFKLASSTGAATSQLLTSCSGALDIVQLLLLLKLLTAVDCPHRLSVAAVRTARRLG